MTKTNEDEVRNIKVSNLLEAGKSYKLPVNPDGTYTEAKDEKGDFEQEINQCVVTWERVINTVEGDVYGSDEQESFSTLEEANKFAESLKEKVKKQ